MRDTQKNVLIGAERVIGCDHLVLLLHVLKGKA
jgi:hypothetical protein